MIEAFQGTDMAAAKAIQNKRELIIQQVCVACSLPGNTEADWLARNKAVADINARA